MGSIHPGEAPASTRGPPGCSGPSLLRLLLPRGWAQGEDTRPPPTMPGPPDPIRHLGGGRGVRGGVPTLSPGEGHLSGANGGAQGSWGLLPPECRARAPGAHSVGCGPPGSTRTSESLRRPSPGSRGDRSGGSLGAGCQKLCGVCMCSQVDHMIGTLPRLRGEQPPLPRLAPPTGLWLMTSLQPPGAALAAWDPQAGVGPRGFVRREPRSAWPPSPQPRPLPPALDAPKLQHQVPTRPLWRASGGLPQLPTTGCHGCFRGDHPCPATPALPPGWPWRQRGTQ